MDRVRHGLALAAVVVVALGLAACGDDETDPGRERLLKAVDVVTTEEQMLHESLLSYRRNRVAVLERRLERLEREGGAGAGEVRSELNELRQLPMR